MSYRWEVAVRCGRGREARAEGVNIRTELRRSRGRGAARRMRPL